jgi:penicillin amidase
MTDKQSLCITRKLALGLGLAGLLGSLLLFAGDMLFYYNGAATDLAANMAAASSQRIILSALTALLGAWFYTLGAGQVYYAFQPAKKWLRMTVFLSFAAIMIAYGVVHGAYVALATAAHSAVELGQEPQALMGLALQANQSLRTLTYLPFAIFTLLFIPAVWQRGTHYPRWILIFSPIILFLLNGPVTSQLSGAAKTIIGGGYLNLILLIFFGSSTLALALNHQEPAARTAAPATAHISRKLAMKKVLRYILLALVVILILFALFAWRSVTAPWPQTQGEIKLAGLQAPVSILRDEHGTPHIYASNTHDLFMAQGYVHAQDRFWQMEMWRRAGAGRLAETFGESQIPTDKYLRTLGIVPAAQRSWEAMNPDEKAIMEAYAQGVNAYLDENRGHLALDIQLLKLTGAAIDPEPWTPLNTLTWATMMSLDLGKNYKSELHWAQVLERYGPEWLNELTVDAGADYPPIIPQGIAWDKLGLADAVAAIPADGLILGSGVGVGSNNWVVSGQHTQSGKPLLANDPHLGIQMPSIWYENGLHCQPVSEACPFDVMGYTFPSTPAVVVGHNQRIAWGVTNAPADVQDLFIERVNPENPNQYEVNGQWQAMDIRQEEIRVAGREEPEIITLRSTRHGPIINDIDFGPGSEWAYGRQPMALQWTALETNHLVQAIFRLNLAQDWESFREAISYWDAPAQNFVYADVDGNIGFQMSSRVPIRAQGDGQLPVPGWNDDYAWTGYIPFDDMPHLLNPPQGFIVTANNRPAGPETGYFIGNEWAPGYRAQRIAELLTSKDQLTINDFQQFMGDSANLLARALIPTLADITLPRPEVAAMRDRLLAWDTQQTRDSAEALIFEDFYYHLSADIFEDELDELRPHNKQLIQQLLAQPDAHWWDDIDTEQQESMNDILARALNETYDDLIQRAGKEQSKWRWGDLHTATFRNQTLGQSGIGPIEAIFNRGPYEADGGNAIINANSWSGKEPTPFEIVWIPSMRMIVDMADLSRSVSGNSTGQSGHAYHKHYDDQCQDWADVRLRPMLWERAQVEAHVEDTLTLIPAP